MGIRLYQLQNIKSIVARFVESVLTITSVGNEARFRKGLGLERSGVDVF